ncbi:MAG: assimilatory sulfite reductase (NADPH) flavoprotein subunit [Opitutales bacterium]|nr:assimilatory sulfite reductase (NADPH) flavoprotein subunit [Opitutales bacterium]
MSNQRKIIPDNAPFTREETEWLDHFFTQMSPEQATWLNGFVSGFQAYQLTDSGVAQSQPSPGGLAIQQPQVSSVAEKPTLMVLFGSESGNAEALAADTKKLAQKSGFKATLLDMADSDPAKLSKESNVMVIISTWGEGDPPERATGYYQKFMAADAPRVDGLNFAVLGLGDTSYEHFCQMGKDFDKKLEELGGNRIQDRIDCDVDYEDAANKWIDDALKAFSANSETAQEPVWEVSEASAPVSPAQKEVYGKKNPFPAELTDRVVLNGTGSGKETLHLELSLQGSGIEYQPGDALAVLPVNDHDVVTEIVQVAGLSDDQPVTNKKGESVKLHNFIMEECDATVLSKVFIEKYNGFAQSDELTELLKPENKPKLQEFIWGREIVDLLIDYPVENLSADNLTSLMRRLPPRLYSIASSQRATPDEVHLTVAAVRYFAHRRHRKGVCSTFLADRIKIGDTVPVYVQPNKHFKLPESGDAPVIMVGPGTGIAPFRAFLQERETTEASGKNWLFFGDQHFTTDFLYQLELQDFFKDGIVTKIDTAFSRDTPEKVYVQHRMLEKGKEIYQWLEEDGYFYVCGDASKMAPDVHGALKSILQSEGSMSEDAAEEYLDNLKKQKRYQRDVY